MRGGPINRRWARQIGPYGCPDYFVHLHNRPLLTRKEARWNFNWDIKQLQNLATMGEDIQMTNCVQVKTF